MPVFQTLDRRELSVIEFADALPQTTSGKIRRTELQEWDADGGPP